MKSQDLMNSILQLAIQGNLVPQNPNDAPAKELLAQIQKKKEQLIKDKKIKRNSKESTIFRDNGHFYEKIGKNGEPVCIDDEIPFEVPESWEWCKLENLSQNIHYGFTASANNNGTAKLLRITDIQNNQVNWDNVPFCSPTLGELKKYMLYPEDIVIARTGGTVGKSYLLQNIPQKAVFASYLIRIIPLSYLNYDYLKLFLETPLYWNQLKKKTMGTGQPNVNANSLKNLLIPIPPSEEQKRIVDKIEELIPYVEEYGEAQEKLEKLNETFPEKIRASILQEAVQGNLVPQNPDDVPAKELLAQIEKEKEQLIKNKKIKRNSKESVIFRDNGHFYEKVGEEVNCIDEEIHFQVPSNWEILRLNHFGYSSSGKTPKAKELVNEGKYPYFKVGDMNTKGNEIYLQITEKYLPETYNSKTFTPNSIVYPKNGGAVFTNKKRILTTESVVDLNTGVFTPYSNLNLKFMYYLFQTINFKKYYKGTALPTVNKKLVDNLIFGLPPLKEQQRIVDKIERLFEICKKLDKDLSIKVV